MTNEEILKNLQKELEEETPKETKKTSEDNNHSKDEVKNGNENVFKKKKKNKKKKNKNRNVEEKSLISTLEEEAEKGDYITPEFVNFKESFLLNEKKKQFLLEYLVDYRIRNYTDIESDEYLLLKMKHPKLTTFVMQGSFQDLENGTPGFVYFLRPLYKEEFSFFNKNIGDYNEFYDEFIDYCLTTCIEYPKFDRESVKTIPAGRAITLFHYIKEISDLTKKFQIIEV